MELNFTTYAAIILFLVTYALIVTEQVQRTVIALCGAMAMVLLGVITQEQAIHHIDFNTLALLIGMMIQVLVLSKTGLFRYLAVSAAQKTRGNPVALLISLSVIVAVCSALLDNVTTVLLTVPISFTLAKDLRISPLPFVIAQILSSNIGGTSTMIGDPPNIMIASSVKGMDFMAFISNLALPCAVVFVLTIGLLIKSLQQPAVKTDSYINQVDRVKCYCYSIKFHNLYSSLYKKRILSSSNRRDSYWWKLLGSNQRPHACQACTLTS